ncbi:hypothetical protein Scep_009930 [Stephania cephalantha]|uniref:Uncharacterized protein n=1 Tax=Stephania cephalantha TaxID=152367 RepID=A0AAP0JUR8_9MAGN
MVTPQNVTSWQGDPLQVISIIHLELYYAINRPPEGSVRTSKNLVESSCGVQGQCKENELDQMGHYVLAKVQTGSRNEEYVFNESGLSDESGMGCYGGF